MCYDAGVGKYPIMGGRYTMDTYPRLAKELDLAWAPDKSRMEIIPVISIMVMSIAISIGRLARRWTMVVTGILGIKSSSPKAESNRISSAKTVGYFSLCAGVTRHFFAVPLRSDGNRRKIKLDK